MKRDFANKDWSDCHAWWVPLFWLTATGLCVYLWCWIATGIWHHVECWNGASTGCAIIWELDE